MTATVELTDAATTAPTVTLTAAQLDAAPIIALTEEIRIDGDASADTKFSNITGIAVTGDGGIAVLDKMRGDLRVFEPNGTMRVRIGGKGSGPGEFKMPQVLLIANDTIYVEDTRAINRFTTGGEYIDRVAVTRATGGFHMIPQRLDNTNDGIVTSFSAASDADPNGPTAPGLSTEVFLLAKPALPLGDKLFGYSSAEQHIVRIGRGSIRRMPLLTTERHMTVTRDARFYVAGLSGRSIDVLDRQADTVRRIVFDASQRPVTDADVDSVLAHLPEFAEDPRWLEACASDPALAKECKISEDRRTKGPSAMRKSLPRAKYFPAVGRLIATSDGDVMVERPDLAKRPGGSFASPTGTATAWNLLKADGAIIGRIDLPAGFEPMVVHTRLILGVMKDGTDVPSVVGYRMSPAD